ncbi:PIG-L family deacetylase [uncultured Polaribacter sp.]|uniref:PIG-L family deacetylase n=1 Tax=uncultured Polaribacter sp. TaxID=174711 RepID=UPI002625343A|nr:PIG-L family deacetylase [uncultured Polaribacter sp.]
MNKQALLFFFFLLISFNLVSQKPQKLTSNQIFEKIEKLNFLGTALYIAAHPDDENTRLIAYLANTIKARTGYLSLTRGDGGQNLIGSEIRELLGVIRTQELLAARAIDGGEQFFTRANDFGYSKHPDEALEIWNKKEVLSDVVWAIRTYKPDVIINRFNHRTPGTTHGHHTASAILSLQAFDLASNKDQYTEQLKLTSVWQPKRLFFNTSSWFYKTQEAFEKATKGKLTSLDVGVYYPLKGMSNNELASVASSQHLCQGFGRLTTRGAQNEYIEFLKGDKPTNQTDIFSGIDTTWNRIENGQKIGDILYDIEQNFDFRNPEKHLSSLMQAYVLIKNISDPHWQSIKEKQIKEIIEACAGLYLEANAMRSFTTPNSNVEVAFEVLNRSKATILLTELVTEKGTRKIIKNTNLTTNQKIVFKESVFINQTTYSDPYWLKNKATLGMYNVADQKLIGLAESQSALTVDFKLLIDEIPITITKNVVRKYAEKDQGEIYEPFSILPKVTTKLSQKVIVFSDDAPQTIFVEVRAGIKNAKGTVALTVPENWNVLPKEMNFNIQQINGIQKVAFQVYPSKEQSDGKIAVTATLENMMYDKELVEINYSHIPKQVVLLNSEAKVVRLNVKKAGNLIGYIQGSGDAVPESLRQLGYSVTTIKPSDITTAYLQQFDAIVLGIRAYNVVKELKFKQKFLLEYVYNGGNMIVQYNTNRGVDVMAPYQLELSRDRVTDENASVFILDKNHSLLNYPNKITTEDFKGWVQERGLYFPNSWSKEYTPIFSMNDTDESPKKGSLLVAKYGKGNYIYTGLSFFRELPAGVSGAYKLFANMLSVGK